MNPTERDTRPQIAGGAVTVAINGRPVEEPIRTIDITYENGGGVTLWPNGRPVNPTDEG